MKRFHEITKHGWESQRTESLGEGDCCGHGHGCELPFLTPVLDGCQRLMILGSGRFNTNQRIMRVRRWLWDQHLSVTTLDEMDRADISHDFGTGVDLGVEFFLELY